MNSYLISQFIDNELNLDEKIEFTEAVGADNSFHNETLEFLKQEKLLQREIINAGRAIPSQKQAALKKLLFGNWLRPAALFSTGLALGALLLVMNPVQKEIHHGQIVTNNTTMHRFIIFRPLAEETKIVGTFTNWKAVPMQRVGESGYWALSLDLSEGEHQYSFFVEEGKQIADPTILERVQDDFGGQNSIITIEV